MPDEDILLSASRGPLSPPNRRELKAGLVLVIFAGLGAFVDRALNDSFGVGFVAGTCAIGIMAGLAMFGLTQLTRRRTGDFPTSSTIALLLVVYSFALAPPIIVLGGVWLDGIALDDPLFGGKGIWFASAACCGPALEVAWRHWHVRSLRRAQSAQQIARMAELERLATTDSLTGLANRRCIEQRAAELLTAASGLGALLLIDLDRFKAVNDTYGHAAGDRLLQEIASRLLIAAREDALVARLGGDEFAILITGNGSLAAARSTADRIHRELREPVDVGGALVHPGASVGIAEVNPQRRFNDALREADAAMYREKADRRRDPHASVLKEAPARVRN